MRSLVLLVAVAAALAAPATADATRLSGRVLTGRTPLARAQVKLYAAGPVTTALGRATTGADGRFAIDYAASTKGRARYAIASGGDAKAGSAVRLMATVRGRERPDRQRAQHGRVRLRAGALPAWHHGARLGAGPAQCRPHRPRARDPGHRHRRRHPGQPAQRQRHRHAVDPAHAGRRARRLHPGHARRLPRAVPGRDVARRSDAGEHAAGGPEHRAAPDQPRAGPLPPPPLPRVRARPEPRPRRLGALAPAH